MNFCFGNSHVGVFSGSNIPVPVWPDSSVIVNGVLMGAHDHLPWFRTFNLGAVTAYQSMKHIQTIKGILTKIPEFNKEKDTLILVFGEVDIRVHVYKRAILNHCTTPSIVKEVAVRYFRAVSTLLDEGFNVAMYGCIPTAVRADMELLRPAFGTVQQRNEASALFDDLIKQFCIDYNLPCISIFKELLFQDGMSDIRYMDTFYMGEGNGLHLITNVLPLLLWKCRDVGLIPFNAVISQYENKNYT